MHVRVRHIRITLIPTGVRKDLSVLPARKTLIRRAGLAPGRCVGDEERERLEVLIRKGKSPAKRLLKARILLKADVSEDRAGWSDSRIIKALDTNASMIYRVRRQLVEDYALVLKDLADVHFAGARTIVLVQDNLNTHC
jgi:hypothetical protein